MAKKAYIGVGGIARKVKKGYVGAGSFVKRDLPAGYTQVAYIESTGTQYIDTGIKPNQNTKVEMVVSDWHSGDNSTAVFGAGASSSDRYEIFITSGGAYRSYYAGAYKNFGDTSAENKVVVSRAGNVSTIDGVSVTNDAATFSLTRSLYLMAYNSNGEATRFAPLKTYSCQVWGDGVSLDRDYVTCIQDSTGAAGVYDMVDNVFEHSAGTEEFIAGPTCSDVAHKIKKAYIGIGGVARPCWSGGKLVYYGTGPELRNNSCHLAATSIGNYALFGGGYNSSSSSTVTAFNAELTRSSPTALSAARYGLAATANSGYALFGGGRTSSSANSSVVDAYNTALTRSTPTALTNATRELAAASVGGYALFGGGDKGTSYIYSTVYAYDTSLTQTKPTALGAARYVLTATTVGGYALFAGGKNSSSNSKVVDAYDASLTRTTPTSLSVARHLPVATAAGGHALIGGGCDNNSNDSAVVDAYDTSLTRTIPTALSVGRYNFAATSVDDYALFGGGGGGATNQTAAVDVYDSSLTRTTMELSAARYLLAATTVGNYAMFGGGRTASNSGGVQTTDVYTVA